MRAADRVAELTAAFAAPSLDVAGLLCDRHPTDRTAFTVVDSDGKAATLTFAVLHGHAVVTGGFHCARAAFGPMKRQGYGRIVSFSSMSWRGNFGQTNYVAAKAGIVGMTRTLALEGARHGITANAIAPGLIDTPMLASMNGPARDKLTNKVPMRHTGRPEDIAEAAAFLASEAAGYITGVVLDVDGGISIGSSIR